MSDLVHVDPNPFAGRTALVGASAETSERGVAEVQAMLVVAKRFPRDQRQAMDRILFSCARPGLAAVAAYQYARCGQDITGPSIRMAEELARQWGNMTCGVAEVARRDGESEAIAYAWDLETNTRDERRFVVPHIRSTRQGVKRLTDERDIYELIANQGARRKRAAILTLIPGDVTEAAMAQCAKTLTASADTSAAAMRALCEAFAPYGVTKAHIETRIQRRLDAITPAQVVMLRRVFTSLRDGMATADEFFQEPAPQIGKPDVSEPRAVRRETKPPKPETTTADPETIAANAETHEYTSVPLPEIIAALARKTITQADFCAAMKVDAIANLPLNRVLDALAWIDERGDGSQS